MSVPRPPIDLEGHCSTINDDTLYVLSPGGFQSLPLKKHAKWSKEASGIAVTGPACVKTGNGADANFWVLGGTSKDASFSGIQRYSFSSKSWQTLTSEVPVMQGRTNHSAAYLENVDSILVYAGAQQNAPSWLSSETFTLSTQPPYAIQAFTSQAPPANVPILQPWDAGSAVMVGGSTLNTQISIFSPAGGWQALDTTLVSPLSPGARGTVIDGSDGSKVLEVYDANVSPNNVAQIVLLGAGGVTAATGQTVGNSSSSRRRKRDLTLANWPQYNKKNAPTAKRTDFSVATDSAGNAVLAGGNNQSPVALFNQDRNSWIDASQFFDSKNQQPLKPTKSHHTTSSLPSSSSTSTSTPGASKGLSTHDRTLRTLGIILGVLCGIAVLFALILLFLRWRKQKKRQKEGWLDEKTNDRQHMSFADRGVSKDMGAGVQEVQQQQSQPPQQPPNTPAPWRLSKNGSQNSMAIISGIGKRLSKEKRNTSSHAPKRSYDSTTQLVKDRSGSNAASDAPVELSDIEKKPSLSRKMTPREERSDRPPTQYGQNLTEQDARNIDESDARANRNRSSGWSKYFATSAPQLPSAYGNPYGKSETMMSDGSAYSNDGGPSQQSRIPSSALVPALDQPLSQVTTRSPAFNDSREDLAVRGSVVNEGQKGLIVDPTHRRSQSESISSYNHSARSSARTSEVYETAASPWSPTAGSFKDHVNARPSSSVYEPNEKRVPSRGKSSHFFPGAGTSQHRHPRSPKDRMSYKAAPSSEWAIHRPPSVPEDSRDSNVTVFPKGVPSLSDYPKGPPPVTADYSKPAEEEQQRKSEEAGRADMNWPMPPNSKPPGDPHDSNVTVFPRGVPSAYYANRRQIGPEPALPVNENLSWVNLGANNSPPNRI